MKKIFKQPYLRKLQRLLMIIPLLISIPSVAQITWDGSESDDWGTAANWDGGVVPGASDNVIIPAVSASNYKAPTIATDAAYQVNNLTIQASGRLEIGGESATLVVNGNTENAGLIRANTNSSLVLLGTYSGTGSGTFANSRSVYGNSNYSIYAVPFTDGNVGLFNGVYAYKWNNDTGEFDALDYSNSTTPGEGYFVSLPGFSDDVFSLGFGGSPVGGDVDVPVTLGSVDDFNLIGNPYTAAISVSDFLSNSTNAGILTGVVYFWDDGGKNKNGSRGGDFITANSIGAVGTNNLSDEVSGAKGTSVYDGYITSMQGFYVEATSAGDVSFTQSMQVIGNNDDANFYRSSSSEMPIIKLSMAGDDLESETLVAFHDEATFGEDYSLDAKKKISNNEISLYTLQDKLSFAIQALPSFATEDISIPIGYEVASEGDYLMKTKMLSGFSNEIGVWLVDLKNKTSYNLLENVEISVHLSEKASNDRFILRVASKRVLEADHSIDSDLTLLSATENGLLLSYPKSNQHITIYDANGKIYYTNTPLASEDPIRVRVRLNRHQVYILRVGNERIKFSLTE